MVRALRAAALLIVVGLIVSAVPMAWAAPSTGQPGPGAAVEASVSGYVNRISIFINNTLRIAEQFNITLNESLQARVDTSLELIGWAKANLSVNATLAAVLATRASIEFAPVAEYVWSSVPADAKKEMEARMMEKVVSARLAVMKKIEEKLRRAEHISGVNLTDLLEALNRSIAELERARELALTGNVSSAHKIMVQATREIKVQVREAYKEMFRHMEKQAALSILVLKLVDHVYRLEEAVNRTLQALNNTNTSANLTQTIQGLVNRSNAILRLADMLASRYPANMSDPAYQAILTIRTGLNTSIVYLELALNASIQGNTTWVAVNLSLALEVLNQTLANVSSLDLPVTIKDRVIEAAHKAKEAAKKRAKTADAAYTAISEMLDKKMEMLQQAYEKYKQGKMPAMKLRALFQAEKLQLERLKNSLSPGAPDWLIQKIDNIISWINEHMP